MSGVADSVKPGSSVSDTQLRQIKAARLERTGLKALGGLVYKGFEFLVKGCVFFVEAVSDFIKENPEKHSTKLADDINKLFFDLPYRSGRDEGRTKQGIAAGVVINQGNAENIIKELADEVDYQYRPDIREGLMAGLKYRYGAESGIPQNIRNAVDRHFPQSTPLSTRLPAGNDGSEPRERLWANMPDNRQSVRIINISPERVETINQVKKTMLSTTSDIPGFVQPKLDEDVTIGSTQVSLRFDDTIDEETGRPVGLVMDTGDRRGVDVWNTYENDESSENKTGLEVSFKNRQTTFKNLSGGEETLELSNGSWKLAKNALYVDEKTGKFWYLLESKKSDGKILVSTNDFTLPDTE